MTRSLFRFPSLLTGLVLGMTSLVSVSAVQAEQSTLLKQGEKLVRQHCTRCHVVGDLNKYGGIGSTPSFGAIKSLPDWQDRFAAFWSLLPHPSVVQVEGISPERPKDLLATTKQIFLTPDEVDAILTYVDTVPVKDLGGTARYQ